MKKGPGLIHKLLLTLIGFYSAGLFAQGKHRVEGYLPFEVNGKQLSNPFTGGFNAPIFSEFDVNNDGRTDIVVFDRSDGKILVYLRNKTNGGLTYSGRYEKVFPKTQDNKSYLTFRDLHNTGKPALIRDGLYGSLYLHNNKTNPADSFPMWDTALFMESRNRNPETSDLKYNPIDFTVTDLPSWADIDGDGDLDYVVYDNFYRQFNLHLNYYKCDTLQLMEFGFGVFRESLTYNEVTLGTAYHREVLQPRGRHVGGATSLLFDNDEDGDMDMLISNLGYNNLIFLKNGKKETGYQYDTMIYWDSIYPRNSIRGTDFELPACYFVDMDGDGIRDLVVSPYTISNTKSTNNVWMYKNSGKNNKPEFTLDRKDYLVDETVDLGGYTAPAFCDLDNDGDMDLVVASDGDFYQTKGLKDRLYLFRNTGTSTEPYFKLENSDWLSITAKNMSMVVPHFMDVDGDGDKDLLLGNRTGMITLYKNIADAGNPANYMLADTNILSERPNAYGEYSAPAAYDYNNDGLMDLLVGRVDGRVELFVNQSTSSYVKFTNLSKRAWGMKGNEWIISETGNYFESVGYAAPCAVDLGKQYKKQILVGTLFGEIRMYEPGTHPLTDSLISNPNWVLQYGAKGDSLVPDFGSRVIPAAADLNGDSIPEILVGTTRGGLHFIKDSKTKFNYVKSGKPVSLGYKLFPNPAESTLFIERRVFTNPSVITIYNNLGQQVFRTTLEKGEPGKEITLNLSAGVYMVKMAEGARMQTEKLVVHN